MRDGECVSVGLRGGAPVGREGGRGIRCLYRDSHTTSIFNPLTRCLSALLIDGDHVEEQCALTESGSIKSRGHFHAQQIYLNVSDERQGINTRVVRYIRPAIECGCYCACFFFFFLFTPATRARIKKKKKKRKGKKKCRRSRRSARC